MHSLFRRIPIPGKGRGLVANIPIHRGQLIHSEFPFAMHAIAPSSICLGDILEPQSCCIEGNFCSVTCKGNFSLLHHRILCGRDHSMTTGNFPRLVDQVISRIFCSMLLQDQELKQFGDSSTQKLMLAVNDLCYIDSWDQPQLESIRRNYELLIDWLKMSNKISASIDLDLERLISWELYLRVYSICHLNTFGVYLSEDHQIMNAVALFREASMFNHSCVPNVQFKWNSKTPAGEFYAISDIDKDEELQISYIDQYAPLKERSKYLSGTYGFDCSCKKCLDQKISL
jgi:hypothetical protein